MRILLVNWNDRENPHAGGAETHLHEIFGRLARAGHAYWAAHHTLDAMAADYQRVMAQAAARPAPIVTDLPAHFTEDYTEPARRLARQFGVELDILR